MQTGKLEYFHVGEMIIVIYAYRFFKAKCHHHHPHLTEGVEEVRGEKTYCRARVKSASLEVRYCFKGEKKEFQNLHFISFSVFLISAGFMSQCCQSLLFLEMLNAGFSDKAGFPGFTCNCN